MRLEEPQRYQVQIAIADYGENFSEIHVRDLTDNNFNVTFKPHLSLKEGISSLAVKITLQRFSKADKFRERSPSLISQKNLKMFEDPKFYDFKFIVQGEDFNVHRAFLGNVSPVFARLFTADMEEAKNNECVITDIEPKIFKYLLHFIYGEVLPQDLQSVCVKLYEAAHYEIEELKEICIDEVPQVLSRTNSISMYNGACLYEVEMVKKRSWELVQEWVARSEVLLISDNPFSRIIQDFRKVEFKAMPTPEDLNEFIMLQTKAWHLMLKEPKKAPLLSKEIHP
jgi:hypothetical protein